MDTYPSTRTQIFELPAATSTWLLRGCTVAVVLLVALRAMASLSGQPSGLVFQEGAGGTTVVSAPIGGMAWLDGVQPGARYIWWPDGLGGDVAVPGGDLGVPDVWPAHPWSGLVVSIALVVGGLLLSWAVPLAGALTLVLAASYMANDLVGWATVPFAALVLVIPVLALLLLTRSLGRRATTVVVTLTVLLGIAVIAMVGAPDSGSWAHWWSFMTLTPALAATVVALAVTAGAVRRLRRDRASGQTLGSRVLGETQLGRYALRAAREEGRDVDAQRLHDRILPTVTAGLNALDVGHTEVTATLLRGLAVDLRARLDEDQLVVLRSGGLAAALEGAVQMVQDAGIPCSVSVTQDGGRPRWAVEVAAWRTAQEALNNACVHSSASTISVLAAIGPRALSLDISDDGVGIDDEAVRRAQAGGHLGVVGMVDRARDVGAQVSLVANEPSGTRIRFTWPA